MKIISKKTDCHKIDWRTRSCSICGKTEADIQSIRPELKLEQRCIIRHNIDTIAGREAYLKGGGGMM